MTWLDCVLIYFFVSNFFEAQTFFSCWLLQIFSSYLLFQNEHFKMFMLSQRYPLFSWFFIIYYFVECWSNHNILFSCVCDNNTHLCENCELWCENWRLNKLNWIELNPMNPMVKLKEPKRTNVQTLNRIFVYLASFVRSTFGQRITLNFLAFTMFKERN